MLFVCISAVFLRNGLPIAILIERAGTAIAGYPRLINTHNQYTRFNKLISPLRHKS